MGPAGLPKNVVEKLNKAVNEALAEPDIRQRLDQIGYQVAGGSPESFQAGIQDNIDAIRALNIKLD